ncbi:MAG: right-handed parallel beta-helix repeat-containing protein [Kineosporiaceae bacterium]
MRDLARRRRAAGVLASLCAALAVPAAAAQQAAPAEDASVRAAVSPEEAQRLADLVEAEDERLIDIRTAVSALRGASPRVPYRVRSSGAYTLVLTARRAPYTIADLRRLAPQTFVPLEDDSLLLREHLLIDPGATVSLAPEKATTIRLASSGKGFVSIVNNGGRLRLLGRASAPLTVTSWDETLSTVDPKASDGRAYVRSRGQVVIRHSTLSGLGFWSGRTGGLSISFPGTPQTGVELDVADRTDRTAGSTSSRRLTTLLPTGGLPDEATAVEAVGAEISDTTLEGNAYGVFVSAASGVRITNVKIRRSVVSGLVLHRSVSSAVVRQVLVEESGVDGVVITKGVEGTTLSQIEARRNGRDGIHVNGSPLASGPSASGQSTRRFGGNVVATSTVVDNGRTGVRIVGGENVRVLTNSVTGGPQGIVVDGGAEGVVVEGNRVSAGATNGIHVRASKGVEVRGNAVDGSPTGIRLSDAGATVSDNTVSGATLHAVTLVGLVGGSTVGSNRLSGAGTSPVDVVRATKDPEPIVGGNDTSGWARTLTRDSLLSTVAHPMTIIWIAVGLLVVGTRPLGSRRATAMPTPYPTGLLSPASIPEIEQAQRQALEAAGVVVEPSSAGREAPLPRRVRRTVDVPPPYEQPPRHERESTHGSANRPDRQQPAYHAARGGGPHAGWTGADDEPVWSPFRRQSVRPRAWQGRVSDAPSVGVTLPDPAAAGRQASVRRSLDDVTPRPVVVPQMIDLAALERDHASNDVADWLRRLEEDAR